jgi:predicted phosphodiesterase
VRLHVLSDLHLEQAPFELPAAEADVLVLAGDIAVGADGVRWARRVAAGRPALYVAGNHEFYGQRLPGLIDELHRAAAGSTVHVLEDRELVLGGVRFLGCSLWSDFELAGASELPRSMSISQRVLSDYAVIRHDGLGAERPLRAEDTRALHIRSRDWLRARLAVPHEGPTVVVTHHAPIVRVRPEHPILRAVAGAFASDLSEFMGADRAALWVFGHTHRVADLSVGGTRLLSNPRGYPHEPVAGFDPGLVVEVPSHAGG